MHKPLKKVERCNKESYDNFQKETGNIKKSPQKYLLLMQLGWLGGCLFGKVDLLWEKGHSREMIALSLD